MKLNANEALTLLEKICNEKTEQGDVRRAAANIIYKVSEIMLDDEDWTCYQLWKAINEIADAIWTRNREIGQ